MKLRFPFFKKTVESESTNQKSLIDDMYVANDLRYFEIMRSFVACRVCLHEAGHYMIADACGMVISEAYLPKYDFPFVDHSRFPTIRVENPEGRFVKPFLLSGLLGELNRYDDYNSDLVVVDIAGATADLKRLIKHLPNDHLSKKLN